MSQRLLMLMGLMALAVAGVTASARGDTPATQPIPRAAARPTTLPTIAEATRRGVAYLVRSQNPDGSWGTGRETRGFEVLSTVPGSLEAFKVATTALCVMALREAGEQEAHDHGVEFLLANGDVRRDSLLYNTWAHIYALQALSVEMRHTSDPRLRPAAVLHLKRLGQFATSQGGWNYYDLYAEMQHAPVGPTSFGTAAGLVALWEARRSGIDVPQRMVDLCLKRLSDMQLSNGAYLYGEDYRFMPRLPANQPRGSVGRTQACNYALWLWGAGGVNDAKVRSGLEFFFREHPFIDMGRKRQLPHEAWYQTAPYYYYFGHYYTAKLLENLGPDGCATYGARLAEVGILPYQEADGSWWDFAMWDYHKPYGTAFAVMTLLRCQNPSARAQNAEPPLR